MPRKNGYLSYYDGTLHRHDIWVMSLEQSHSLSGTTMQGRYSRQFYPRNHSPGDLVIGGQCSSQRDYQELALFIRKHHRALLAQPSSESFNKGRSNDTGYRRLMQFVLESEGVLVRGFIPKMTITKRGVHDPAPKFSLALTVIYDSHTIDSMRISQELVKYYSPEDGIIADTVDTDKPVTHKQPVSPASTPTVGDIGEPSFGTYIPNLTFDP